MIDINDARIGDIWCYHNKEKNQQYIGTIVAITDIAPPGTYSHNDNPGVIHDMFITVNWIWIRDPEFPDTTEGQEVTYDSLDLKDDEYHAWINKTTRITEKERLAIIISTK